MTDSMQTAPTREVLETMVAEADTGGRKPTGFGKTYIFVVSLAWSLFQLWYASPLPYKLQFRRRQRRPGAHHSSVVCASCWRSPPSRR